MLDAGRAEYFRVSQQPVSAGAGLKSFCRDSMWGRFISSSFVMRFLSLPVTWHLLPMRTGMCPVKFWFRLWHKGRLLVSKRVHVFVEVC